MSKTPPDMLQRAELIDEARLPARSVHTVPAVTAPLVARAHAGGCGLLREPPDEPRRVGVQLRPAADQLVGRIAVPRDGRIAVLHDGRIGADGAPVELAPRSRRVSRTGSRVPRRAMRLPYGVGARAAAGSPDDRSCDAR